MVAGGGAEHVGRLAAARPGLLDEPLLAPPVDGPVGGGQAECRLRLARRAVQLGHGEGAAHLPAGPQQHGAVLAVPSKLLHGCSVLKMGLRVKVRK